MTGFGEQLRTQREQRGLSLETMCAATKVKLRHLEALEHDDFRALPGGVFRRGIVRAYLMAAGLEEQTWMPRFEQSFAEQERARGADPEPDAGAWIAFAENVKRNRAGAGRTSSVRWVGVLLLLLAVAGAAWTAWHFVLRPRAQLPAFHGDAGKASGLRDRGRAPQDESTHRV